MADVKYVVSVDSTGAITQIKALDKAWDELNATGKETAAGAEQVGQSQDSLWKQMAVGQIVAQALMKAFREMTQVFKQSIAEAIGQEDADNRLRAALETTGRTVEGNIAVYKRFAAEKMALTKYTDDEVQASETLLLQMTNLDQNGIKRAIEGAMGLSAVMGTDLQSATMMVTKAMEGNYTALQRVGITVNEALGPQEKQAELLNKLVALYPRAEAEMRTFGGAVAVVKKNFGEAMEAFGTGIIKNEDLKKSVAEIGKLLQDLGPELKEFGAGIGQLMADIAKMGIEAIKWINKIRDAVGGNRSAISEEEEAWKKVNEKLGGFSGAMDKVLLAVGTAKKDFRGLDEVRATLLAGMNELGSHDALKAMAEGKYGEDVKKALEMVGGEAVKFAMSLREDVGPAVNQTGNAADIAAEKLSKLKNELKAVYLSDVTAEIKKIEEGLAAFGDQLTRTSFKAFEARLAELRAQLPKAFTGIEIGGPIRDETATLIEDLYGVAVAALFMKKEVKDSGAEIAAALSEAGARSKEFDQRIKAIAGPTLKELSDRAKDISWVLRTMGEELPAERVKELEAELKSLDRTLGRSTGFEDWAQKASDAMTKVSEVWSAVSSSMSGVVDQAQKNREIAIENEYKKRLNIINSTIKDETKKQAAIVALEAEFQIKRTAAQAAAARQSKAIALMDAIVNTADAVTKALTAGPIIGPILAGIIGAMGAIQIALIAKQPIPLARGAVFKKPVEMTTSEGQSFKMGEEGVEYLVPEKHLAGLAKGLYGAPRGLSGALAGGGGMVLNINSPLVQTSGLNDADLTEAGDKIFRIVERKLRGGRR